MVFSRVCVDDGDKMIKGIVRHLLRAVFIPLRAFGLTPPESVFKHLHFEGPFRIKLPGGEILTLMSWGNRVENELYWRGWKGHEPDVMQRWVVMAKDGGDILDIGANTGTFAFIAKAISPESKVFAFEPVSRIAKFISKNCEISGLDVTIAPCAVSNMTGELPIYDPGGENAYSASLDAEFLKGDKTSYLVPVVTIDNFCEAHNLNPKLIKLDVEGVEAQALLGASKILAKGECKIICEWGGASQEHEKAIKLLKRYGYIAVDLDNFLPINLSKIRGHADRNILILPKHI